MRASDLAPGDLFSTVGPKYWDTAMDAGGVGERLYVRTNSPSSDAPDADAEVYRVTVQLIAREEEQGGCTHPDCQCAVSFPEGHAPSEATECPAMSSRDDA